ncbi:hypothetical protein CDAR_619741 [Caerostris darwini]|uniref:Uncharacterized protein n=1 Tax=Caerostris darwini TaxID=1538125 RepID=A0AAV4SFL5_9ARAC|nr:hypothetical protein CDAR_619741 [Caerostris darwini]
MKFFRTAPLLSSEAVAILSSLPETVVNQSTPLLNRSSEIPSIELGIKEDGNDVNELSSRSKVEGWPRPSPDRCLPNNELIHFLRPRSTPPPIESHSEGGGVPRRD